MKNHEVVPTNLISSIAALKHGGVHRIIGDLARRNLVAREKNVKYDGYRLTYGGYDYLALKTFSKRSTVHSVGQQIGVGKESDIHIVADSEGRQLVLKIQRLGRVSFRSIKNKRDYLQKRRSASWMYMSRLAAIKEFAFMRALHEHEFPVPQPIDQNRHCVVMSLIDGFPLYQVEEIAEPGRLYSKLMDLIVRLAQYGLIHGDFNEFNLLITANGDPILIDFPQMVSTSHVNAEFYFNRDVECVRAFFRKRFQYESALYPRFSRCSSNEFNLDVAVAASGFTKRHQRDLEELMQEETGEVDDDAAAVDSETEDELPSDEELVTESENETGEHEDDKDEDNSNDSQISSCDSERFKQLQQQFKQLSARGIGGENDNDDTGSRKRDGEEESDASSARGEEETEEEELVLLEAPNNSERQAFRDGHSMATATFSSAEIRERLQNNTSSGGSSSGRGRKKGQRLSKRNMNKGRGKQRQSTTKIANDGGW